MIMHRRNTGTLPTSCCFPVFIYLRPTQDPLDREPEGAAVNLSGRILHWNTVTYWHVMQFPAHPFRSLAWRGITEILLPYMCLCIIHASDEVGAQVGSCILSHKLRAQNWSAENASSAITAPLHFGLLFYTRTSVSHKEKQLPAVHFHSIV